MAGFHPENQGSTNPIAALRKATSQHQQMFFTPNPGTPPNTPIFAPKRPHFHTTAFFIHFYYENKLFWCRFGFFFFRIRHNREALPRGNWVKPTRLGTFYRPAPIRARKWGKTHPFLTKTPSFPPESRSRRGRRETTGLELLCHPDPFFFFFWCGSIF